MRWKKGLLVVCVIGVCLFEALHTMAAPAYRSAGEYAGNPAYQAFDMKVKNVTVDETTGVIAFQQEQEGNTQDTTTYFIDADTYVEPTVPDGFSLKDVIEGTAPWLHVSILKEDYEKTQQPDGQPVHIAAVGVLANKLVLDVNDLTPIKELERLGIAAWTQDGVLDPRAEVSRAELAQIVMAACKDTADYPDAGFCDVPASHPAYGAICGVRARGLMQGYGDGIFGPEDSVTMEQAAKLLICLLGYEGRAELYGGYPNGYYAVAKELGMLNDMLHIAPGTSAKRQEVAWLVYRTLYIPLMENGSVFDGERLSIKTLYTEHWMAE